MSNNAESHSGHTVPIIHGYYIELCRQDEIYLKLMQDGAPRHAAGDTRTELQERSIEVIFWPAFSPDLNPIERVWHIIKNYLADNFPGHVSCDRLGEPVKEAWSRVLWESMNSGSWFKACQQDVNLLLMPMVFSQNIRYENISYLYNRS